MTILKNQKHQRQETTRSQQHTDINKMSQQKENKHKRRQQERQGFPNRFIVRPRVPSGTFRKPLKNDIRQAIDSIAESNEQGRLMYQFLSNTTKTAIQRMKMNILSSMDDMGQDMKYDDEDEEKEDYYLSLLMTPWFSFHREERKSAFVYLNKNAELYDPPMPLRLCENYWISEYFLSEQWDNVVVKETKEKLMNKLMKEREDALMVHRQEQVPPPPSNRKNSNKVKNNIHQNDNDNDDIQPVMNVIKQIHFYQQQSRADSSSSSCYIRPVPITTTIPQKNKLMDVQVSPPQQQHHYDQQFPHPLSVIEKTQMTSLDMDVIPQQYHRSKQSEAAPPPEATIQKNTPMDIDLSSLTHCVYSDSEVMGSSHCSPPPLATEKPPRIPIVIPASPTDSICSAFSIGDAYSSESEINATETSHRPVYSLHDLETLPH
ncbi:hypothetical protein BDA99DRAFT_589313 [Phascolomyces articulosus]|uniref:Uncharacterized protein n=1 Tax=Phascolomyces articulosus TaxID=60185 RepID=A0AAD5JRZ1_9FUNG|nr:hypothetical protein BDA99DRAFT_589313 [Phascolomyces articulosus]